MNPLKGQENPFQKFRAHSHPIVLAQKIEKDGIRRRPLRFDSFREMLVEAHADASLLLSIFYGVSYNIDQNLPNTQGIADQVFLMDPSDFQLKGLPFLRRLRPENHGDIVNEIRKGEGFPAKGQAPAVDPGHIQNIIHKTHQMGGGGLDF